MILADILEKSDILNWKWFYYLKEWKYNFYSVFNLIYAK